MRKIAVAVMTSALMIGSLAGGQTAFAAQTTPNTTVGTPAPAPSVQPLDCIGTTGRMGCGPGWFWRDGWRGWGCYPC